MEIVGQHNRGGGLGGRLTHSWVEDALNLPMPTVIYLPLPFYQDSFFLCIKILLPNVNQFSFFKIVFGMLFPQFTINIYGEGGHYLICIMPIGIALGQALA